MARPRRAARALRWWAGPVTAEGAELYRLARKLGLINRDKPSNYQRFKNSPIVMVPLIAYRGDTRAPAEIKAAGGFLGQGRASVTTQGLSSGMVPLTRVAEVAATYYAYSDITSKASSRAAPTTGYVYAIFVTSGSAVDVEAVARKEGSPSQRTREVTPLKVPWSNVIGWRRMPTARDCRPSGGAPTRNVSFASPYEANPVFDEANLSAVSNVENTSFNEFKTSETIEVLDSKDVF